MNITNLLYVNHWISKVNRNDARGNIELNNQEVNDYNHCHFSSTFTYDYYCSFLYFFSVHWITLTWLTSVFGVYIYVYSSLYKLVDDKEDEDRQGSYGT